MLARFPPSLRLPSHVHERACLTVLLDGVMAEHIRGRERYCERASVLIKPGLERHEDVFGVEGSSQIILEPLDLTTDAFEPYRPLFSADRFLRDGNAERLATRLAHELEHPDACTVLAVSALAYELIVGLERTGRRERSARRPAPSWLRRVHELLLSTTAGVTDLSELARVAQVHPAHLTRAFRAHYGCSIGTFVRRRRIEAAARDIADTDIAIAGVATMHGFTDQSHFTRQFRRHFGLTPLEYRHRVRPR